MTRVEYLGSKDPFPDSNPDRIDTKADQCEIKIREIKRLVDSDWRAKRYSTLRPNWDPERCQRQVAFRIDGKCLCRIHAGKEALRILMEQEKSDES